MSTTTPPATPEITAPAALELVQKLTHSRLGFKDLWGEFGRRGRGLVFEPSAVARLGEIFGAIEALSWSTSTAFTAQRLAHGIVQQMDRLSNYGGVLETLEGRLPACLIELRDDGTWGGFSLLWYRRVPPDEFSAQGAARTLTRGIGGTARYHAFMNGGLIFHGLDTSPGGAPTFSVRLGDGANPWSVHT